MSIRTVGFVSVVSSLALVGHGIARPAMPVNVRLSLATLHAATLTTTRAAGDSSDLPYFLVSILGPHAKTETAHLPATGHLTIHRDEALGARPLASLSLMPGDSVRLLVTVLEGGTERARDETRAAVASVKALSQLPAARSALVKSALGPVTNQGTHWLGSAVLLITNEGGVTYWRALECVATCKVVKNPSEAPLATGKDGRGSGVVELNGAGGVYHLQINGERTS